MKRIRFEAIIKAASIQFANIDRDIYALRDDFEDGKITANAARRKYSEFRKIFLIRANRYYKICKAAFSYDPQSFEYYKGITVLDSTGETAIVRHDEYFYN